MAQRLAALKDEIQNLRSSVEIVKGRLQTGGLASVDFPARRTLEPTLKRKKSLSGHTSRVNAIDWAVDSVHVLSARYVKWDGTGVICIVHLIHETLRKRVLFFLQPRWQNDYLECNDKSQSTRYVINAWLGMRRAGTFPLSFAVDAIGLFVALFSYCTQVILGHDMCVRTSWERARCMWWLG